MATMAQARTYQVQRSVQVAMRDGVQLATTVLLPHGEGPFPAVLVRTAYNRTGFHAPSLAERGLALVVQDCRGRYDSEGDYYPFIYEAEDGFDTLDWIAAQPWCNGRIGMFGDSYLAATQLLTAPLEHPNLCALNPRFMADDCWKRAYYCDGVFSLALTWSWLCFECNARTSDAAMMPFFDVQQLLMRLPIQSLDELSGAGRVAAYRDYVSHAQFDSLWEPLTLRGRYGRFKMPVLLIGGWYDYYAAEAARTFTELRQHAPTAELRNGHRLLIGPWTHGINATSVLGELDFGEAALRENDATDRWLDCILHGGDPAQFQQAPVRVFTLGVNRWQDFEDWPPPDARPTSFYLREAGRLSSERPGDEVPDRYTYDPADPVPTLGGNHSVGPYNPGLYEFVKPGPYDQGPVEQRDDVRIYSSDILAVDTEVTGPVIVELFAASSAPDTDFVARLTDVYPDGRSINITEGVIRARFREDVWGAPALLEPHRVYAYTIDLQATSNVFRKGHRIRLDITSSNFPLWDRNLNTGNDPGSDTEMRVADQTLYHDATHPSRLVLPIRGAVSAARAGA